ncbi:hypothetical protein PCIT_b0005 [Pseudoalteromonas citrea]|uniref:Uncharacterized protein n=2 Tax=Pseudoalteromonas citrea TaxID=43655 RepID=A0AAD4FPE6_9GAMM|nr:hypothetical protein [Pseudoalteromonas citrea]KAF7764101.1 hypothetical protein PCIT_b0005 [Pseudoalteromonas citrea]
MNSVINEFCVADYLKARLEEAGVEQMFGARLVTSQQAYSAVGEDEINNPNWPPENKF